MDMRDGQQLTSVPPWSWETGESVVLALKLFKSNQLHGLSCHPWSPLPHLSPLSSFTVLTFSSFSLFRSLYQHLCHPNYLSSVLSLSNFLALSQTLTVSLSIPVLHARAMKLHCPLVAQWHHNRAKSGPSCRTRHSFIFCCCWCFLLPKKWFVDIYFLLRITGIVRLFYIAQQGGFLINHWEKII